MNRLRRPYPASRPSLCLLVLLLASVTPAFGQMAKKASDLIRDRLQGHIQTLSRAEETGRGPGSSGLDLAGAYVADQFSIAGLTTAGDGDTYFQAFVPPADKVVSDVLLPADKHWGEITLRNVVGVFPGKAGPEAPCVVVGAHYDHLGLNAQGERYPGADDNASGIAILCELASRLRLDGPFRNTIVLVAFSGEEEGTLGSKYYTEHPACPLNRTLAMLNLDTVGRMDGTKLYVFGSSSAAEFPDMIKGINMGANLDLVLPEKGAFASDQISFYDKGIPVLHFFSGPNVDYHRPTDTEDKINYEGLLGVLQFVQETAEFLADRTARLTFVPAGAGHAAPVMAGAGGAPRRTSLGTVPDFSRESGGVLIQGTMPGSPAEKAGLLKGDIVTSLGGQPIDNLADFTAVLKGRQPGDSVEVVVKRGDQTLRRRVQLVERK